jgi:hypothetical protein
MQLEDLERFSDELNGEVLSEQCMDLTGREIDDFEIQITGLATECEIADTAADQPDPSAPTTDCIFNTAKDFPESGVFQAKAGRHLDHRFTKKHRGFFR